MLQYKVGSYLLYKLELNAYYVFSEFSGFNCLSGEKVQSCVNVYAKLIAPFLALWLDIVPPIDGISASITYY